MKGACFGQARSYDPAASTLHNEGSSDVCIITKRCTVKTPPETLMPALVAAKLQMYSL